VRWRPALAVLAFFFALALVGLRVRNRSLPSPAEAPSFSPPQSEDSQQMPPTEVLAPSSDAASPLPSTASHGPELHALEASLEATLPPRLELVALQSTHNGYVADLAVDGLPLLGARFFVTTLGDTTRQIRIVPNLKNVPRELRHRRALGPDAEERAREAASRLSECEIFSIARAREVWFNTGDAGLFPAYAVEVFYRCDRQTRREDWIYRDPDLERIGTLRKR